MKFKVKIIEISTGGPFVVLFNESDAQRLDVRALDRVRIKKKVCLADVTDDETLLKPGYIGVFLDTSAELALKEHNVIEVARAEVPNSVWLIKKKLDGKVLNEKEMNEIIKDLVDNSLTESEVTFFVAGCYTKGMSLDESAYLTKAIVGNSGRLNFKSKIVLDKHSIGGLPNNRTTPIIVSIVAAAGFLIPKTSTRSISSVAGTSDTVEVLAPVSHSKEKIMSIVKKTNGCMVWGGTLDLASADDILIKIERTLGLDPEGILLASILAKKSAADSTHIVIDIPVGDEAKIQSRERAKDLGNKFVRLGKKLGLIIKPVISDGSQPVGNGIGPALEARDVLEVLMGDGPPDLREKSLFLAGTLLKMAGVKDGFERAKEILESGLALKKMKEIIKAQGGDPNVTPEKISVGKYTYIAKARSSGKVVQISNHLVTRIGKAAGAPNDKGAGVYLHRKVGEVVKKGEVLCTIYAESKEKLENAKSLCAECVFRIK
ncbi:MAG: AMP phosphorylase [Candidatus Nanoarchaeia archaeon]